jgi:hypothetical protein
MRLRVHDTKNVRFNDSQQRKDQTRRRLMPPFVDKTSSLGATIVSNEIPVMPLTQHSLIYLNDC